MENNTEDIFTCPHCDSTKGYQNVRINETCKGGCGGSGYYLEGTYKGQRCANCHGKGNVWNIRKQCKNCRDIILEGEEEES